MPLSSWMPISALWMSAYADWVDLYTFWLVGIIAWLLNVFLCGGLLALYLNVRDATPLHYGQDLSELPPFERSEPIIISAFYESPNLS